MVGLKWERFFSTVAASCDSTGEAHSGAWIQDDRRRRLHAWNGVNYNLAVARRLVAAEDPLYLQTLDLRMALYAPADLFFNYFRARHLRWNGDKQAIRYLKAHDPDYLVLFQRFVSEQDRTQSFGCMNNLPCARWNRLAIYGQMAIPSSCPTPRL
ncbi:MAG: hypothetical protein R2873_07120 [Caldilineaceae bacterium]